MDFKTFSRACDDLYRPGLTLGTFVERGSVFLRSLVAVDLVAFGLLQKASRRLHIVFDQPHANFDEIMEAFGALMGRYELYRFDPTVNDGKPFCRSQFFSQRAFRNLDIFQEVYRPLDLDNHCAVHVRGDPGEVIFFGLERKGGCDFESCLDVLEAAQAQLSNALGLARAYESAIGQVRPDRLVDAGLTPREAETLYWISEGKSNVEIATLLGIGLYTVKDHVRSIFDKAGVGNRLAAINWAREKCSDPSIPAIPCCQGAVTVPALLSA